jgi:glyoxylase-like metal-dependent hydrolase (beta-lactamase superfamily II)
MSTAWPVEPIEISPGIYLLTGESEGRFPYSHSVLVDDDIRALIDTGAGIVRLKKLRDQRTIDMVIASHSHPDHTAGNWLFEGLPLYVPEQMADGFGRTKALSERFVEPGCLAEIWRRFVSQQMGFQDALPTHTYDENHTFDFGNVKLMTIATPGHVIDHTCFFEPTQGVLLSFDLDLTAFGPWYGHRESDIEQFKASIRHVMRLRPRIVVSSHKGIIRDDISKRLERFLAVFDEREAKIRALIGQGKTVAQMVEISPIYGGYPYAEELLRYWERQMIIKHIAALQGQAPLEI